MLALGAVAAVFAVNRYGKTENGRRHLDLIKLRFPITGELILKISVARFARTLATLLASGIPILKALEIVEAVVANRVLADAIQDARASIQEGASISAPLRASGVFPPILIHMVAIGEQSGQLEDMLGKVANAYDSEVATATMQLTSLLEPVIILLMAGIVVFIALAILQPIFQLNQLTTACAGFMAVA
jgi:general secretion pathway protein F